ncbi:unnamed protein product [Alopecurus aequalis]
MSLRRLLAAGLSAASGRPRFRSLSTTTASHPPVGHGGPSFAGLQITAADFPHRRAPALLLPGDVGGPHQHQRRTGARQRLRAAARRFCVLLQRRRRPPPRPVLRRPPRVSHPRAAGGGKQVRHRTGELLDDHKPDFTYLVCNPLSGQVSRIPNICGTTNIMGDPYMGLLTQTDRGYGLPERFAVARIYPGKTMIRFLSQKGRWDLAECPLPEHPLAHGMGFSQEPLAFHGRLWWVDLTCGAMSVDPFSDRTDIRFVKMPNGSVLPKASGADEAMVLRQYRRMGFIQGRLRYAEMSQREPFVLSSFALDEEGVGEWTLEHRVALSRVWTADGGGHPWLPLQGEKTPQICVLDPLNANTIHLLVGEHVVAVDMHGGKVIGSSPLRGHGADHGFMPCVLESGQIPSTGMGVSENQSSAHVRVHSNCQWKYEEY